MPLGEGPVLILEQVGRQHSGTYQCKAENSVREAAYADVNLKVLCKFPFPTLSLLSLLKIAFKIRYE